MSEECPAVICMMLDGGQCCVRAIQNNASASRCWRRRFGNQCCWTMTYYSAGAEWQCELGYDPPGVLAAPRTGAGEMTRLPAHRIQCDRCLTVVVLQAKDSAQWGEELHSMGMGVRGRIAAAWTIATRADCAGR